MSKAEFKEIRLRRVSLGQFKRIRVAAAECDMRPCDFCYAAINVFLMHHEKEQSLLPRAKEQQQ
jgi:hypothetical protein